MIPGRVHPVIFTFREDTSPAEREQILAEISGWREIADTRPLVRGATNATVSRIAYAYAHDNVSLPGLIARLQSIAGVESASLPSERYAV